MALVATFAPLPDLLADFGIYGDRAVGTQELDEQSRTVRFTLSFDPQREYHVYACI